MSCHIIKCYPNEIAYSFLSRQVRLDPKLHQHFGLPLWRDHRPYVFLPCFGSSGNTASCLTPLSNSLLPYIALCLPASLLFHDLPLPPDNSTQDSPPESTATTSSLNQYPDWIHRFMPATLRLCPLCMQSDLKQFGEWYLHREHQLPGIFRCPTHPKQFLMQPDPLRYPQEQITGEHLIFLTPAFPLRPLPEQIALQEYLSVHPSGDTFLSLIAADTQFLVTNGLLYGGLQVAETIVHTILRRHSAPYSLLSLSRDMLQYWDEPLLRLLIFSDTDCPSPLDDSTLAAWLAEQLDPSQITPLSLILLSHASGTTLSSILQKSFPNQQSNDSAHPGTPLPCIVNGVPYASQTHAAHDTHRSRHSVSRQLSSLAPGQVHLQGPFHAFGNQYASLTKIAQHFGLTKKYLSSGIRNHQHSLEALIALRYYKLASSPPALPPFLHPCRMINERGELLEKFPVIRTFSTMLRDRLSQTPPEYLAAWRQASDYAVTHPEIFFSQSTENASQDQEEPSR